MGGAPRMKRAPMRDHRALGGASGASRQVAEGGGRGKARCVGRRRRRSVGARAARGAPDIAPAPGAAGSATGRCGGGWRRGGGFAPRVRRGHGPSRRERARHGPAGTAAGLQSLRCTRESVTHYCCVGTIRRGRRARGSGAPDVPAALASSRPSPTVRVPAGGRPRRATRPVVRTVRRRALPAPPAGERRGRRRAVYRTRWGGGVGGGIGGTAAPPHRPFPPHRRGYDYIDPAATAHRRHAPGRLGKPDSGGGEVPQLP